MDFQKRFPTTRSCWQFLVKARWPKGFQCPKCQHPKACLKPSRKIFECYQCHYQVSVTAGTIFHKSKVPLRKWFWAIFLVATSKKGTPALYLQKQLGIGTYRTAWLMCQKIRKAMSQRDALYQLNGTVEADEIFIGGKQSFEKRRKVGDNKTPFLITVEETPTGKPRFISFEELESIYDEHLVPALKKKVQEGAQLKTDGGGSYQNASKEGYYKHDRSVYLKDKKKTQEHLKWVNLLTSNLKRFILSTHHGVHPRYREAYLTEFAYRFNRRYWPYQTFNRLLYACVQAKPAQLREIKA